MEWKRCRELHREPAIDFKGYVELQLVPINGLRDTRIASQRAYCQRHAYQQLQEISSALGHKPSRKTVSKEQTFMFGDGI